MATFAFGAGANAQVIDEFTCGNLQVQSWRTFDARGNVDTDHWRVTKAGVGPSDVVEEVSVMAGDPWFRCHGGNVLIVSHGNAAAHFFLVFYLPDGSHVSFDDRFIERRGNRFVLPIQVKPRVSPEFKTWFLYHCKIHWDPLPEGTSKDECS
jgi:hypothetical protein